MWLVQQTYHLLYGNIVTWFTYFLVAVTSIVILATLFVFNVFASMLIFSYFNDVIYEVIFFFLVWAASINIAALCCSTLLQTLYVD